jgi:tetrapyrrole methylase family protein/MazG family protein
MASYDGWYETADSFAALYARIVDDLAALASSSPNGEVVYAVPGSPLVAEHTVELLRTRDDIRVVCEPAVSVIDVACGAVGVDPMSAGLRIVDALDGTEPFRGPGPLLILQTYAPEVLATVADRLPADLAVLIVHHAGLADERVVETSARELPRFLEADHLTSLWVPGLRTAGEAVDDLVSFMHQLRQECPWDQEQTHASLTRHLVEETYEALDALDNLAAMIDRDEEDDVVVANAEEELGDVLFQVIFHAELASEEERFTFATIADAVRDKLTQRHPHVFGDVEVNSADDVAANWEVLKQKEKGRSSVLDGIAWQLPALALYAKVLKKARAIGLDDAALVGASQARELISRLRGVVVEGVDAGVDVEGALRAHILAMRDAIREIEHSTEKS